MGLALYQRKRLSTGENIGEPGPLPADLAGGLTDADLARLGEIIPPEARDQYGDTAFVRVAGPAAPTVVSTYEFLLLFTPAERIAIRTAAQSSMAMADWLGLLDHVSAVHLGDPNTIAGLNALEASGLLAGGRATQILANTRPA